MKRNTTIDIVKMICAVLVIAIHSDLFCDVNSILHLNITSGIAAVAVPFFFVTSGYFFYDRIQKGRKLTGYLLKILLVFVLFTLIDGLMVLILNTEEVLSDIPDFVHMVLLSGARLKYWYMTSLLFALLIVIPFWRRKIILPCLIIGTVLYLFMMTSDSYYVTLRSYLPSEVFDLAFKYCNVFHGPQAGISSSLMFVSLGALINKKKPQYKEWMLPLSLAVFLAELNIVQHRLFWGGRMYVSLIILAPVIFMFCLKHPGRDIDTSFFSDWCLLTYMTHHFVVFALMDIGIAGSLNFVITCITVLPLNCFLAKRICAGKNQKLSVKA